MTTLAVREWKYLKIDDPSLVNNELPLARQLWSLDLRFFIRGTVITEKHT